MPREHQQRRHGERDEPIHHRVGENAVADLIAQACPVVLWERNTKRVGQAIVLSRRTAAATTGSNSLNASTHLDVAHDLFR